MKTIVFDDKTRDIVLAVFDKAIDENLRRGLKLC